MTVKENDIKRFIKGIENVKVGTKTTNGLYVIRKAGSNRAGFIKFDD